MGGLGYGVEDADHSNIPGPVVHGGSLSSERVSGPDVSVGLSPALLSQYQAVGPAV